MALFSSNTLTTKSRISMPAFHLFAILLTVAALCSWLNYRFIKLPAAIGVMAISLVCSVALIALGRAGYIDIGITKAFVQQFDFQELVLHGILAFLLFAGGLSLDMAALKTQKGMIAMLSSIGVLIGTCLTGTLFWCLLSLIGVEIPFVIALLFGAIVSPTDAVAILGILRKVGVPKSLEVKLVGESLFNDGIGVVVFFSIASLAYGAGMTVSEVGTTFILEVFGGSFLGCVLGWTGYRALRAIDDHVVEILITLALAGGGYALAEASHVSAPICVVVAGLITGNQGYTYAMSQNTQEHLDIFWELIDELLNVMLFVLMGLEIITLELSGSYWLACSIAIFVVLMSRTCGVASIVSVSRRFRTFSPHAVKILTWGGLRGGISVALALSLPESEYRSLIVLCTYAVVLFSVLVQGITLPMLLRYAKRNV